jgi:hypothetical protein
MVVYGHLAAQMRPKSGLKKNGAEPGSIAPTMNMVEKKGKASTR